ncbi:MAG: geranylgeranylglyceryl/heptaprenylglyceryl phosphate synthase [Calditrichia bacterium]
MKAATYQQICLRAKEKGAGFILLLDPDKLPQENLSESLRGISESGVDALFIGGTFLIHHDFNEFVRQVKAVCQNIPVILFPGSVYQVSPYADALLYLSVISGRNPAHLIENQVIAAPLIWQLQIEPISCGYMLVESGRMTSAEFMSNSRPLPRNKPELALAHALAAQYLGFKLVYLEGGSGAQFSVPDEMVSAVSQSIEIPTVVGGGIRSPEEAAKKVRAGADFIVIGNQFEDPQNFSKIREFAEAIHSK